MRGRTRLYSWAFVAAVITSPIEIAAAQTSLQSFRVGSWNGGAFARDGRFTHCAASATYASGVSVRFAIDRQYRWGMDLANRDWQLRPGGVYELAFSIDGADPIRITAKAANSTEVSFQLADSLDLFNRFRRGNELRVASIRSVFTFNLADSSVMLARLHDCVRRHTQPASVANLSASKQRPGPSARDPVADPALQAEAAVLLANVMAAANVSGYSMGAPEEAAKIGGHAFWTAPSALGTLLIVPHRRIDDREIPGFVTGVNASGCEGAFMSASLPVADTRTIRVTTTCQRPGEALSTSYYFGVPRPRGGIYLFTTRTTRDGGREDVERADDLIRQATYRTVN
jgi:hypothetical protein